MDIQKKERRHKKIRASVSGTETRPRLFVSRSNNHIYASIINDDKGITLAASSDKDMKGTKMEKAKQVGENIAKLAKEKKIEAIVFDRGGYKYHGRVKALAEGAREIGLKF